MSDEPTGIWLEVSNVRKESDKVSVQLKGDREDREPVWWSVDGNAGENWKEISTGLDKKRTVLAKLSPKDGKLQVGLVRIQHADSAAY
jgi:hypothetical protein